MGNYEPIPLNKVPKGTKLLDMVWSMQRKRRIKNQEVYKWKARLNVHGGQQVHGVHYWDTYAPIVTWHAVRFFFNSITDPRMAKSLTRLCHGLSTGPCRNAIVDAFAPGVQTQRNIKEETRTQAGMQWIQTKAGRSCME